MLGASCNIGPEAGKLLRGKTVILFPHNDAEGGKAAKRWVDQITGYGATMFVQRLPSGKDLNEFLISPGNENPLDLLKDLSHGSRGKV